jgi:aspartate/methionine/tyrosine aminotransferase
VTAVRVPLRLPDFPWDALVPYGDRARDHPLGIIDLSVGSPVDPTPQLIRDALTAATDAHSYPQVAGTPALREAIVEWYGRRRGVSGLTVANVLPSIGSKELIAWLPLMLGLGAGDARTRELGAVIANDECYAELNWGSDAPTPSILDPRVIGDDRSSVLSVYSLSKQSNLAGYRAGFVAGCRTLIAELLGVRKHAGLIPPAPVQAAMIVALGDEAHVDAQRELYRSRRDRLRAAVEGAGFRIDHSEAGLYLWATRGQDAWETVAAFAEVGVLVVPGTFYGDNAPEHVRIALTVSDAAVDAAVDRIAGLARA